METEYIPPASAGIVAPLNKELVEQRVPVIPDDPPERLGRLRRVIVELDDGRQVVFHGVEAVSYSMNYSPHRDGYGYAGYTREGDSWVDGKLELRFSSVRWSRS